MQLFQKARKVAEAVNLWYATALLLYTIIAFLYSHTALLLTLLLVGIPIFAGWGGYLLRGFIQGRTERHGFSIVSDIMSYEIFPNNRYLLRYATTLKARADHLMTYPLGYQWSGAGETALPKITSKDQQLLAPIELTNEKGGFTIVPFTITESSNGVWQYSFVAFNPPIHKGKTVELRYSQEFHDKKGLARPMLYYFARTPMKQLELRVKFPPGQHPASYEGSFIRPADPSRPIAKAGVQYDEDDNRLTWVIHQPKRGYCYRITWKM